MSRLTRWLRAPEPTKVTRGASEVEAAYLAFVDEMIESWGYDSETEEELRPARYSLSRIGSVDGAVLWSVYDDDYYWPYVYVLDRDGGAQVVVAKRDGEALVDGDVLAGVDADALLEAGQPGAVILKALEPAPAAGYRPVAKSDDSQRYTLGVAYPANEVDSHGDWTDEAELEQAAWRFMGTGQVLKAGAGTDHADGTDLSGVPVESYVWRGPDWTDADGNVIAKSGDWLLGVVWTEEAWARIQAGELTGYSIQGTSFMDESEPAPAA
jgi:hypothetical protein